jgi:hypothetical protein
MSNQIPICICGQHILKFHWWGHNISTSHKLRLIKQQARHSLQLILSVSCILATITMNQNKNSVQGLKKHKNRFFYSHYIPMYTYITVVTATIHPYFVQTGQLTKHPLHRRSKKQIFKNHSSLLQLISLWCFKKVHLQ